MTLTEKWDKGELPEGDYYIKRRNGDFLYDNIDTSGVWRNSIDEDILEVLAPVPSYQEYLDSESHCAVYSDVNKSLKEENQQLKELLSKCLDELAEFNNSYYPETQELFSQITNAIGEKK